MAASAAGKEWRGHVEQTKKHEEAIQAALPVTTTQLALIGTEVGLYRPSFPRCSLVKPIRRLTSAMNCVIVFQYDAIKYDFFDVPKCLVYVETRLNGEYNARARFYMVESSLVHYVGRLRINQWQWRKR